MEQRNVIGENKVMGAVNNLAFQYDCTYVISASHCACEALIKNVLNNAEVQEKGSGNKGYIKRKYNKELLLRFLKQFLLFQIY